MRRPSAAVVAACLALLSNSALTAENYPTHALTMIVPFPAGGATDTLAGYVGERMRPILGQTVIIENVAGAAGTLGATRAKRDPTTASAKQSRAPRPALDCVVALVRAMTA